MHRYSIEVRNAGLDARIAAIGPSPVLKMFSGAEPQGCSAPDSNGLLCSITLPETWMTKARNGVATKSGEWVGKASGRGAVASFRIYGGDVCHMQGSVRERGGDMTIENEKIVAGQVVKVNAFTLRAGNA